MIKKIVIKLRLCLMPFLLRGMGFENLKGHWVYSKNINKDSIVIDLGANLGDFTEEIKFKFGSFCYAVEPNFEIYDKILFADKKVNVAISNKDMLKKFYISNNHEASSLIAGFESIWGNNKTIDVRSVTWNSLLFELDIKGVVELLKVDIEGEEINLINSYSQKELENINQLTIEYHNWIMPELYESTLKSINKIRDNGFLYFTSTPDTSWPLEINFIRKKSINFSPFQYLLYLLYKIISLNFK